MHILLIGGTGNISAACAARFLQNGHKLSIVTRGRSVLPFGAAAVVCDRNDTKAMTDATAGQHYDVVINFLGFNTDQLEIDRAVFANRTDQYIFISSCTVYSKPHEQLPLTENSPLGNLYSEYAQNKEACPALSAGIKGDKASHAVFDNAHIKSHVDDFQCRIPFRDGVARSVAWYLSHPEMMTSDPKVDELFEQVLNYA